MERLLPALCAFILTLTAASAQLARAVESNPWRELAPELREALSPRLGADQRYYSGPLRDWDFRAWYRLHYCPSLRDDQDACSDAAAVPAVEVYPEYNYDRGSLDQRISLACVVSRVLREPRLLDHLGPMTSFGTGGAIEFRLRASEVALQLDLERLGYGQWFLSDFNKRWGMRHERIGAELHWYSPEPGVVNVHIDLNNPGRSLPRDSSRVADLARNISAGIRHHREDLTKRTLTHTPSALVAASLPEACGIGPSDRARVGF